MHDGKYLTFHQSVFVSRRRSGQDSEFGPDLIYPLLFDLQEDTQHISQVFGK